MMELGVSIIIQHTNVASRTIVINIRPTGSHSRQYLDTGVILFFSSAHNIPKRLSKALTIVGKWNQAIDEQVLPYILIINLIGCHKF